MVYEIFALLMVAFFLLVGMLLPQLIRSIVTFSQNFDGYTKSLKQLVAASPLQTILDEQNIELLSQNAMSAISDYVKELANNALSIAASAGKNIVSTVIALILAVYLLLGVRNVLTGVRKFVFKVLPENASIVFMDFVRRCDRSFHSVAGYTGGGDPEFCLPGVFYEEFVGGGFRFESRGQRPRIRGQRPRVGGSAQE